MLLLPSSCDSDIDYVEFQRQGGGVISSSVRTFDLLIKQKSNNTVGNALQRRRGLPRTLTALPAHQRRVLVQGCCCCDSLVPSTFVLEPASHSVQPYSCLSAQC